MSESYKKMDVKAATGMITSSDRVAEVESAWARIRSDNDEISWATFTVDGKQSYKLFAQGKDGVDGLTNSLTEDGVFFCGLRVKDNKFVRILYVGSEVGIIKKNKAQMLKNAPFNAMPGAIKEIILPTGEKNSLSSLISMSI
mmetsp:Transcript_4601/g.6544  ORF Transcript_4601/g.6544 Transcript_4601/m.6544 type:complete len:142 (+) Transcript_4601:569-994(+)